MKILFVLIIGMIFASCAKKASDNGKASVYLKKDLSGFSACIMEHSECAADEYCVEASSDAGNARQCMRDDHIGEYFGCTSGDLIIHPMEPFKLACYQD